MIVHDRREDSKTSQDIVISMIREGWSWTNDGTRTFLEKNGFRYWLDPETFGWAEILLLHISYGKYVKENNIINY